MSCSKVNSNKLSVVAESIYSHYVLLMFFCKGFNHDVVIPRKVEGAWMVANSKDLSTSVEMTGALKLG